MVTNTYDLQDGHGIQAFDWQTRARALYGFSVIDGCEVSINTGALGSGNDTLTVASGSVLVAGTEHTISSQSVDLGASDTEPRWDVVVVDDTGAVTGIEGTAEAATVAGSSTAQTGRDVERPAPPDLAGTDVTPLALVWVDGGASSVDSGDRFDVRMPATAVFGAGTVADVDSADADAIANVGYVDTQSADNTVQTEDSGAERGAAGTLNFGSNLTVSDDGDSRHTISASASGSANLAGADGIATRRQNVGMLAYGTFRSDSFDDGGHGVAFEASDLRIESVVIEANLGGFDGSTDFTVELRKHNDASGTPTTDPDVVDSTTVALEDGPSRYVVDLDVPATGAANADVNDEYVLQRGNDDGMLVRRRSEDDGHATAGDWADHTYFDPPIDFLFGVKNATQEGYDSRNSWYWFFDWVVGEEDDRVTSPLCFDIDEMYVRPTRPDDNPYGTRVQPRSMWVNTSGGE